MTTKTINNLSKIFSSALVMVLIFSPLNALAQNLNIPSDLSQDDDFANDDAMARLGEDDTSEAKAALQQKRLEKDAQAAKEAAQQAKQEEEADMQKCLSEQGQAGSKLKETLKQSFANTINKVFKEDVPQFLESGLKAGMTTALTDSLSGKPDSSGGGIDFKSELSNELIGQARERFNLNFKNAIQRESLSGTQAISETRLRQIAEAELRKAFQQSYKGALKKSLRTTLAGDEVNQRPGILKTITQKEMPNILGKALNEKGPAVLKETAPTIFRTNLSTDAFDLTSDSLRSNISATGLGQVGIGFEPSGSLISDISGRILGVVAEQVISQSANDKTFEKIIGKLGERLNGPNSEFGQRLNDFPFETIVSSVSGQINGTIDLGLNQRGSNNNTFDVNISQSIDNVFNQSFGQVNLTQNLGNIADSLISTAFDGNQGQLNNAINGLFQSTIGTGASGLGNVLTGSVSGQVNGMLQNAFSSVAGEGGFAGALVGQLSGPLTDMTNQVLGAALDPINGILNEATQGLMNSIVGPDGVIGQTFGNALNSITGGLSGAISGALGGLNIGGLLTDPIGTVTNAVVSGVASSVVQGLAGNPINAVKSALGLGVFVPTTEQIGILTLGITGIQTNTTAISATTKSTDATVKDTNKLTVEICTKEKSLQRIAAQEAQARNVTNPQMRRDAATIIENWRSKVADFLQKGYKKVEGGETTDNPLFVTNTKQYYSDAKTEAKAVFMDTLANSGNIFKQEVTNSIRQDEVTNKLTSTITKDEYIKFQNGQIKNSSDWWRVFQAINDPFSPNSPDNSERISREVLANAKLQAESQAKDDLQANQNYLPVRECQEYTKDGQACKKWVNITPAIQVKETVAQAFAFRPEKYTDPEPGDIAPGNEPTLDELRLFQPSSGGGGARGPAASDTKDILDLVKNLLERLRQFRSDQNSAPSTADIVFDYSIPPIEATESGQAASAMTINWEGTKLSSCSAGNDWLGSLATQGTILPIRNKGQDLGTSGQVTIPLPLDFSIRYIRTRNGVDGSYQVGSQNLSNITISKTIGLPESDTLAPGDILSIRFYPYYFLNGVTTTITAANVANPLPSLKTAIQNAYNNTNNALVYNELIKFQPTYNENSISFTPNMNYKIDCITESGSTVTKTINVNAGQ